MRHTIYTENKKHKQTVECPLSLSLSIYMFICIFFSSLNVLPWAKRPATGDHMLHEHHAEDHQKETELGIGHLYVEKRSNQESAESNSSNLQQKEGCRRFFFSKFEGDPPFWTHPNECGGLRSKSESQWLHGLIVDHSIGNICSINNKKQQ